MSVKKSVWYTQNMLKKATYVRDAALWELALKAVDKARENCPRRYGYLAASVMARSENKSSGLGNPNSFARLSAPTGYGVPSFKEISIPPRERYGRHTTYVGTNVDYAAYVEFGTMRMEARPFLRTAILEAQEEAGVTVKKHAAMMFGVVG